jgi:hypothetical protein
MSEENNPTSAPVRPFLDWPVIIDPTRWKNIAATVIGVPYSAIRHPENRDACHQSLSINLLLAIHSQMQNKEKGALGGLFCNSFAIAMLRRAFTGCNRDRIAKREFACSINSGARFLPEWQAVRSPY